jgi:hypothetical protein
MDLKTGGENGFWRMVLGCVACALIGNLGAYGCAVFDGVFGRLLGDLDS